MSQKVASLRQLPFGTAFLLTVWLRCFKMLSGRQLSRFCNRLEKTDELNASKPSDAVKHTLVCGKAVDHEAQAAEKYQRNVKHL